MGGRLILRIDDLDPERSREELANSAVEDLRWLGLDWDEGPLLQSERRGHYEAALQELAGKGLLYPCFCSRRELKDLAAAPHCSEIFPKCPCASMTEEAAAKKIISGARYSLKLRTDYSNTGFSDLIYGERAARDWGDFALRRSDGVIAYQLASVVDDYLTGVNLIVRGRDLLESCPRQLQILRALGGSAPACAHLPLILDHEGERLAKRHSSLSLQSLRDKGAPPQSVIGAAAFWAGIQDRMEPMGLDEALKKFSINKVPAKDIRLPAGPLF